MLLIASVCFSTTLSAQVVNPFGRQLRSNRQIIRAGQIHKPDSAVVAREDSMRVARLTDSLRRMPADSLHLVSDSLRMTLPDSLRRQIFPDSIFAKPDSVQLTEKQLRRIERRENRKPLLSDSMALNRMCWASLALPGFGQIYNKQYWKLPILYGTVGASLGLCLYEHSKYKPLKAQFDQITDQSLLRTEELNTLQRSMIKHNSLKQLFMFTTIASYLYFIGDAAVNYSTNEVSQVKKATTLAMICPGAGQIYNKSYWRVPIVVGGFASTIYCIDWNNRGYQRFKKAYRLRYDYDQNPDLYPNGSPDEFKGRYASSFLKNLRNSYRRNRDLCIILTAGLYVLQIVDAHVDAHLRDYDVSDDLSVDVTPMVSYNPSVGDRSAAVGMNVSLTF
ncbi:MAG: hypothetical protein IJ348_03750 [Alistipes sp.]|nr:hypothetical protein [Alistipes sp.]